MTYQWRSPGNARAAKDLVDRLELARLQELEALAEAQETAVLLVRQRAEAWRRKVLTPLSGAEFVAEAEAYRLRALERWPDTGAADQRLAVLDEETRLFQNQNSGKARKALSKGLENGQGPNTRAGVCSAPYGGKKTESVALGAHTTTHESRTA